MKMRPVILVMRASVFCIFAIFSAPALSADPLHATAVEVNGIVDMLRFRGEMFADPTKGVDAFAANDALGHFARISKQMTDAGSGLSGWRFLLGTSVFTVVGLDQPRTMVVFYNPWVDIAVLTLWEQRKEGRRIIDVEWVPGDLVRQQKAQIEPRPLWLRGDGYRPDTLARSIVTTIKAVETRFADARNLAGWRDFLGVKDTKTYDRLVAPILAVRLYETQSRLQALAVPTANEDPRLGSLRSAVVNLIRTLGTDGFAKPLAVAKDTTTAMHQALTKINPKTLIGLAPVAFVLGEGYATVFLASTATADYTFSARFAERISGYELRQFEFIPYAATYQAATEVRR